ncbi:hypothetical protein CAC42_6800 [Sphaceloma murrayae]|uniref:Uncharacterized protein n=1 Tax=Sphaceloma murrayae TaxID=2082308 RepID=A0A2K1QGJ4_9PEZI|nr:hypothetical protein CAC42_6800 [Sphaceloma murrayae]
MAPPYNASLRSLETIELASVATSQTQLNKPAAAHLSGESRTYPTSIARKNSHEEIAAAEVQAVTSKTRSAAIIVSIAMVTGAGSMLNGIVTVVLPTMAKDLGLGPELIIW